MKLFMVAMLALTSLDVFAVRVGRRTKYLKSQNGPNDGCVKIGPKFNSEEDVYRRVCIKDPKRDELFGGRKILRELDIKRICLWEHKGDVKIQFKTRSSKGVKTGKRNYDLYLLSPRIRGFSGRNSHYDWTLDRKDKWTSYYMMRAESEAGPKNVNSARLRSFNGETSGDDVWRDMGSLSEVEGSKWLGSEYVTFKVKRKYVCPRFTTCHFKITGFAWEDSNTFEVDRIPAIEVCLREEQTLN